MRFGLSILESIADISKQVVQAFAKQVKDLFKKAEPKIEKDLRELISNAIRSQPEYSSLKSGKLRYEFGLADSSVVDIIVDRFVQSIHVTANVVDTSKSSINAELIFSIIAERDLADILSSSEASFVSEKGETIPWLEWLLLRGSEPIILTHRILIKPTNYSRTGQAIMIPTKSGSWRVPPAYVGTFENNWISRAISSIEPNINNILSKHIK